MSAIAQLSNVTLRYDSTVALNDVSLTIARGEWVCVLGANGSGKSTLASVLAGLLAPDEGSVELLGHHVLEQGRVDAKAYRLARRKLGLVFQNPDDQMVTTVVEDDVAFGPENLGVAPEVIGERVARELKRVAMQDYAKADPTRLSGGQKQRVALAGALAMEPELLVLDEPGALLDVRGRNAILRVMRRLHAGGTTLVHITHFMDEALAADRVVVMDHGRTVLSGTPAEVFSHVDEMRALRLEEPFAARLSELLMRRGVPVHWTCNEEELLNQLAGTKLREHPAGGTKLPELRAAQPPCVEVSGVSYTYHDASRRRALNNVSFEVAPWQHTVLVGQTGSGKSTLLRLLCALEVPDAGSITVNGIGTRKRRDRRQLHGVVGYVMQHPERQLFANTVAEDVAYGPQNMGLSQDEVNERVNDVLELVGLGGKASASPFELSGGQQRLCALAGVLATDPQILVLDEPTAGLDPHGRAQLRAILKSVAQHGVTLIEVTHSMESAARADQVVVLNQSQVELTGTPQKVFARDNEDLLAHSGLGLPWSLRFAHALEDACGAALGEPLDLGALADAIARVLGANGGA